MVELSIVVSNSEQSLTQKHLVYDKNLTLSHDDPELLSLVQQAVKAFGENPEDVLIRAKFKWE
jgi:hypothetical protein